ncbi:MAG: DUF4011 domain-containing protein [Clostridia bacterium]|nr:DUF4011 domain-containing protein [Clostridia bacterium]
MAVKKLPLEEIISVKAETVSVYSYADFFAGKSLFSSLQIKNDGAESIEGLRLVLTASGGLLIPLEKPIEEIPYESRVQIVVGETVSPAYFAKKSQPSQEEITVTLYAGKKPVCEVKQELRVLPFDFWQGLSGDVSLLASFVRPRLADCARMRVEVESQLKEWGVSTRLGGYQGADKNLVRQTAAALFSCIKRYAFEKQEETLSSPVDAGSGTALLADRKATPLQAALFFASCLQSFGLYPLLVFGETEIGVGVHLKDTCFLDTDTDELSYLENCIADGVNQVSCFDMTDLFSGKNVSYTLSETHFKEKLAKGKCYERCVDVQRCRIARILPLPLRVKGVDGYEIVKEEEGSIDALPENLPGGKSLRLEGTNSKNKQWERRLLDLSMKNALLNFSVDKGAFHLLSASAEQTLSTLTQGGCTIAAATQDVLDFSKKKGLEKGTKPRYLSDLIALEQSSSILRTYTKSQDLEEIALRLIRKNKEADEEYGAKILYLALGFLKWQSKEDGKPKYAPLILQPVQLKKGKGGVTFTLSLLDEDFFINATLLEFLKQEFNLDARGLESAAEGMTVSEVFAAVRREIMPMKDWKVLDEVCLSTFSFSRYQTWQDLRQNFQEFSQNPIVASLLENKPFKGAGLDTTLQEDAAKPAFILTPLPADSKQWEAIAQSSLGKSFVLHGPPGTGKSQTITGMIANALYQGKRVLFVAEKQAALSVVKKRLDGLGLGDFCLELHSNKIGKTEVLRKLSDTLALAGSQKGVSYREKADALETLRERLDAPLVALHKPRRLGVSFYQAMLLCLRYKNAPDIINIETSFYDGLTEEKIHRYEEMMLSAAAAAKECGGVYNSPFTGVNLTNYSVAVRDAVYCSAEVVLAEIKHLNNYIRLFLDLYRQKTSAITRKKLDAFYHVAEQLEKGGLNKYFKSSEEEFYAFFNANKRLDACLERYFDHYKKLVDVGKELPALIAFLEGEAQDYKKNRLVHAVVKRLQRVAFTQPDEEELRSHLQLVADIYAAMRTIRENTDLSKHFTAAFGRVDYFEGRKNFLADLYALHEVCSGLFLDYNADSFNSMCIRAASGYTRPVLQGLRAAIDSFYAATDAFLDIIKARDNLTQEEEVLTYFGKKASALIENIDMLASWCDYKETAKKLDDEGLTFVTDALEHGEVTGENIVAAFEKNVYKNFLQTNLPLDSGLASFSAAVMDEDTENLRKTTDAFARLSQETIRNELISHLPMPDTEDSLSVELLAFRRLSKNNLRGVGLRKFFEEIPRLLRVIAPCMMMSPNSVAQYLAAQNGLFDLVIFDEASQMPTAEAIGAIARAKSAVIVGDPKQLPPTSFFTATYVDEENLENEDMESILDDCLAIGLPSKHLTWHYRSKHESLIAFSNATYYDNKLCTFPSPDALTQKVRLCYIEEGVYDRGLTKRNKLEGDALVAEVIRRLKDDSACKSSLGVVTFSTAQKDYIERSLSAAIAKEGLEERAYEREEPLFVKNLENVQGDERDVVLFSVCYGPDKYGRISLNFGPLNQAGGWRRLNVAVSRAREEMLVFSSMRGAMIDLSKTGSRGVAGLKAFLEFAEKGRTGLTMSLETLAKNKEGLGKYLAKELGGYGYECRYNVGVSDFKIDVAVVDPKDKHKFILAILCDGNRDFSVKDRNVLQIQTLKRNNWNVARVYAVNYYHNPKREIKKLKDMLDKLTGADKKAGAVLSKGKRVYKKADLPQLTENAAFVTSGEHDAELLLRIKSIVAAEEPISKSFLIKRVLQTLGVQKYGGKVEGCLSSLIDACAFKEERLLGETYYYKTDKRILMDRYRVEGQAPIRKAALDFTPYDVVGLIACALGDRVALYVDEIHVLVASTFQLPKATPDFSAYIDDCITLGEETGLFVRSVADRISLA